MKKETGKAGQVGRARRRKRAGSQRTAMANLKLPKKEKGEGKYSKKGRNQKKEF